MSEDREALEELRRLLGPQPEVLVPSELDERVLAVARETLQPARLQPRPTGPPALAWVLLVGAEVVTAVVVLTWPLPLNLPCQPEPLYCLAVAGYLLTLLLVSPLILIRRIRGGVCHG